MPKYFSPRYLASALLIFTLNGCGIFGSDYMKGNASYYGGGDGYDNKKMADGKIFHTTNPHVCAHPTLPLGTKLKVTNLINDKVIYVEVTDRMPKHSGRVIDLSRAGAKELGLTTQGLVKVKLTIISDSEYKAHI